MLDFVLYTRVSSLSQSSSGLGIEAQRISAAAYIKRVGGTLIQEFTETESGKNADRPQLAEALHLCQLTGATLLVARIDRLTRSLSFLTTLQDAGTKFIAVDNPAATEMLLQLLVVFAQNERKMIASRTQQALQAAKERGPKYCQRRGRMTKPLGASGPTNLQSKPESVAEGRLRGAEANRKKADEFAAKVLPTIKAHQEAGHDLEAVATKLNETKILTSQGKVGTWSARSVGNIINRVENRC